ncbi:MAG: 2-amino-4-hydroxy-6-hydroxymethyldihydropteridine diphosphokinase [Isosphaeraceae bacterium]
MSVDPQDRPLNPPAGQHRACIGLGSNCDPAGNLPSALNRLRRRVAVEGVSGAWQSAAVGIASPDFVNAAALVRTALGSGELARLLKQIENDLGRTHGDARNLVQIDLDLLVYDDQVLRDDLWDLAYRAVPVAELLPDLTGPGTRERLCLAAARLAAPGAIRPRPDILLDAAPRTSRAGARGSS